MAPGAYAPATFSFGFVPAAPGSYSGNIVISFSDGTSAIIPVSGTAVTTNAAITFTPSTLTFANQAVAVPSAAQNITITNTGTDTVNVLGYQLAPSVFAQKPSAAIRIGPGAQIQVPVTFTPKVPGKISGNFNVEFDVLPSIGISLTGTGVSPAGLSISSFPTLPDASANATYQAILSSHGGTAPITWSLASGTLPPGLTLSSAGVISGTPTATGSATFTVRATDAAAKTTTQKASLSVKTAIPANCSNITSYVAGTTNPLVPITDLGTGTYLGTMGGLYPGGTNVRPSAQTSAGISLAKSIVPLDANGNPSATGKYVMIALGTSDAKDEFERFLLAANTYPGKNPNLVIVDGAQGLESSAALAAAGNGFMNSLVTYLLPNAGVTAKQVVALWMETAINSPTGTYPTDISGLESQVQAILQEVQTTFPNIKLAYLSSRIYGGYSNGVSPQSPEPYAYEDAFAMQYILAQQLNGNPALNYNPALGPVLAPWLSWGPYYWANGLTPRSDGLVWTCQDFIATGTHPSDPAGRQKVADALFTFFVTDSTITPWFLAH
jgi:hypothetical protein